MLCVLCGEFSKTGSGARDGKPFPDFRFGSDAGQAFGTPGGGGSFGFADPDARVGFAYAMNRTGFRLFDDPREVALRDAVYRVLGGPPQLPDKARARGVMRSVVV